MKLLEKEIEDEWIYLSDEIILEKLTNQKSKNGINNYCKRILIPNYEENIDYKEVSFNHELVKKYCIDYKRRFANNKKYYIITSKTMEFLLERRKFKTNVRNNIEKEISDRIAKELDGKREACIDDGKRIDILTDEYIIEVKKDSKKLEAIGQILYYSKFYPDKIKRIHLFEWKEKDIIYKEICKSLDIKLTYEK